MAVNTPSNEVNKANATTYGVCFNSVLNTSKYFHVTEGMCPDIMHDVLEGCVQFEMKELINVLIDRKYITLDLLNDRILSFPFNGSDAVDKPSIIYPATLKRSDHSVKQKGE